MRYISISWNHNDVYRRCNAAPSLNTHTRLHYWYERNIICSAMIITYMTWPDWHFPYHNVAHKDQDRCEATSSAHKNVGLCWLNSVMNHDVRPNCEETKYLYAGVKSSALPTHWVEGNKVSISEHTMLRSEQIPNIDSVPNSFMSRWALIVRMILGGEH